MAHSKSKSKTDTKNKDSVDPIQKNDYQKLAAFAELAEVLSEQNNFEEILRIIAQKATVLFSAKTALIVFINPKSQDTIKTIFSGGQESGRDKYKLVRINIWGWILNKKQPFMSANIKDDDRFEENVFGDTKVKSVLAAPLKAESVVIGCLLLLNYDSDREFTESDLELIKKYNAIVTPHLRNTQKLQQYFETPLPEDALQSKYKLLGMLGKSKKFLELLQSIEAASRCDVRVLLEGQTGTGKELVARAVHQLSARNEHPFIAIDCGAIPANLIESELFGHAKGAFTGATKDRKGLFEEADGGTLFMDEIANLPLDMQAKLMRVLQEGEVRPLGSNRARGVNVRVISASSKSIPELLEKHEFREDLYFRLLVYPIHVPPLDERREDIPLLAHYFLSKFAKEQQKPAQFIHRDLTEFMKQRRWMGNIRELENFVERLVAYAGSDTTELDASILPADFREEVEKFISTAQTTAADNSLTGRVNQYERELLIQALTDNNWHQSRAAQSLNIPEQTLRFKMKKLGISKPSR